VASLNIAICLVAAFLAYVAGGVVASTKQTFFAVEGRSELTVVLYATDEYLVVAPVDVSARKLGRAREIISVRGITLTPVSLGTIVK
jgi:hypothetical protein